MQQKVSFCCSVFTAKGSFNISQEGGDGTAQRVRNVIYDCLVFCYSKSHTDNSAPIKVIYGTEEQPMQISHCNVLPV